MSLNDDIERCFEGGWSDGLPVVPPYARLVDQMLLGMGLERMQVVGEIAAHNLEVRAEQLAATAVMAGCHPTYGCLLAALSTALLDPAFNLSGVEVTTGGAACLVVVSGPIVDALDFEHSSNSLGANARANATVGRFAAMVRLFCGRIGGALDAHGTIGHPGRLSFCIAEHPTTTWGPCYAQWIGAEAAVRGRSAVTVMATEGPISVNNHYGMSGSVILETIADAIAHNGSTNYYWRGGGYLVVLPPEHMRLVAADFTREQARRSLYERAVRSTDELLRLGRLPPEPMAAAQVVRGSSRSPVLDEQQITFIESGKEGGKFSAVIPGWVANHVVTRFVAQ